VSGLRHVLAVLAAAPLVLFSLQDGRIDESSGLAVSAVHPGVVYTHNDSGGEPVVYAVGPDGRTRADLRLAGATNRDWEAIAPGRDAAGRPVLWIGDIGDNLGVWPSIRVYRIREPDQLRSQDVAWTSYRLRYEDGPRNAEALLADPATGRLYVVSKAHSGAAVYAAPATLRTDAVNVLRRVAAAPVTVTDGTFLPDGRHAVLRGYFSAAVVDRRWREVSGLDVPLQQQGESVAAALDGRSVLVGTEGKHTEVWRVPLPALSSASTGTAPARLEAAPPGEPVPAGPPHGVTGHTAVVTGVLTAIFVVALLGRRRLRG
jgi:hypothetical protein